MAGSLRLTLDRRAATTLSEQIRRGIIAAIESGSLPPGTRLPSWRDLASQLGVARGTVRAAYDRLSDEQWVVSMRPGGTRVAPSPARKPLGVARDHVSPSAVYQEIVSGPATFQMGVPSSDSFPAALFGRIGAHAARTQARAPVVYPDPRGELELRRRIAGHLAVARGIQCDAASIFVTAGFSGALGLTLSMLRATGAGAWMEDPGFFLTRNALNLARFQIAPIPVDADGLDVDVGIARASDAVLALVTPGQQAPTGATLSLERRMQLLDWARRAGSWIVEDDYLGELQLQKRAAPALASLDTNGRVIHIGSFSKTISPALRLGFIVAPDRLIDQFNETVMSLAPAPAPAVQLTLAEFIREGHYMRHLRRMKRLYAARGKALQDALASRGYPSQIGGLAVLLPLPDSIDDEALVREARAQGLAPGALSSWFSGREARQRGLLLGVATAPEQDIPDACDRLDRLIRRHR